VPNRHAINIRSIAYATALGVLALLLLTRRRRKRRSARQAPAYIPPATAVAPCAATRLRHDQKEDPQCQAGLPAHVLRADTLMLGDAQPRTVPAPASLAPAALVGQTPIHLPLRPTVQPAAAGVVPARPASGCPAQPEASPKAGRSRPRFRDRRHYWPMTRAWARGGALLVVVVLAGSALSAFMGGQQTTAASVPSIPAAPPLVPPGATVLLPLASVGGAGPSSAVLLQPQDAVVGSSGRVYVADTGNHRIAVFSRQGQLLATFRSGADGPLRSPYSLAITPRGDLLVLDSDAGQLLEYTSSGKLVRSPPASASLLDARGIAAGADGRVYVADPLANAVFTFTPDLRLQHTELSTAGKGAAVFSQPSAVAVAPDGMILVVDSQGGRIVEFTAAWQQVQTWPLFIADTFHSPRILPLAHGRLLVSDPSNGTLLLFGAGSGTPTPFMLPGGVALTPVGIARDSAGHVWVTCSRANQVIETSVPGI